MAVMVRHMSSCPECRKFADAQAHVWSALDAWNAEPVSLDFDRELYARISAEERATFWARLIGDGLSWKPALSFAAACATVVMLFVLNIPDARTPAVLEPGVTQVEALEPEQIERSVEDLEMLRQFSTPGQINQAI